MKFDYYVIGGKVANGEEGVAHAKVRIGGSCADSRTTKGGILLDIGCIPQSQFNVAQLAVSHYLGSQGSVLERKMLNNANILT